MTQHSFNWVTLCDRATSVVYNMPFLHKRMSVTLLPAKVLRDESISLHSYACGPVRNKATRLLQKALLNTTDKCLTRKV